MRPVIARAIAAAGFAASLLAAPVLAIAAEPTPQAKLPRDHPDRIVCRRQQVTGSLVQTVKVCKTNTEWREASRNARDVGEDMQGRSLINSCGSSEPGRC